MTKTIAVAVAATLVAAPVAAQGVSPSPANQPAGRTTAARCAAIPAGVTDTLFNQVNAAWATRDPDRVAALRDEGLDVRVVPGWSHAATIWTLRSLARIEDLEFLLQFDGNAESIARRAGFTNAASASRSLDRWGRHDLAARLHSYAVPCDPWKQTQGAAFQGRAA